MELYFSSHLCLYGKNADSFYFVLMFLIKILLTIFELVNLIFNYVVY